MPTILDVEGFRFFFFSNERNEPAHVHVEKGGGVAKVWLLPITFGYAHRLSPAESRRIRELTFAHRALFLERWNEHFNR